MALKGGKDYATMRYNKGAAHIPQNRVEGGRSIRCEAAKTRKSHMLPLCQRLEHVHVETKQLIRQLELL